MLHLHKRALADEAYSLLDTVLEFWQNTTFKFNKVRWEA